MSVVTDQRARDEDRQAASDLGNVQAAEKGSTAYGKRIEWRGVYRRRTGSWASCCGVAGSNQARDSVPRPEPWDAGL
jgi:hypothetical protein